MLKCGRNWRCVKDLRHVYPASRPTKPYNGLTPPAGQHTPVIMPSPAPAGRHALTVMPSPVPATLADRYPSKALPISPYILKHTRCLRI